MVMGISKKNMCLIPWFFRNRKNVMFAKYKRVTDLQYVFAAGELY